MAEDSNELFVERVDTKSRYYFFNVKERGDGKKYLSIVESRERDGKWERDRIMIFEEDLSQFNEGLDKALKFIADSGE